MRATVVALAPLSVPSRLDSHVRGLERIYELLETHLRNAGYELIPAETTVVIWTRARDSLGGFYDTYTGRLIPAKREAALAATRRQLRDHHGANAWLLPSIVVTAASFRGGKLRWDGVEEQTSGSGGIVGLLLLGTDVGTIPATSVRVTVEDMDGDEVYAYAWLWTRWS